MGSSTVYLEGGAKLILFRYPVYIMKNIFFNIRYWLIFGKGFNIFKGCGWNMYKHDLEIERRVKDERERE